MQASRRWTGVVISGSLHVAALALLIPLSAFPDLPTTPQVGFDVIFEGRGGAAAVAHGSPRTATTVAAGRAAPGRQDPDFGATDRKGAHPIPFLQTDPSASSEPVPHPRLPHGTSVSSGAEDGAPAYSSRETSSEDVSPPRGAEPEAVALSPAQPAEPTELSRRKPPIPAHKPRVTMARPSLSPRVAVHTGQGPDDNTRRPAETGPLPEDGLALFGAGHGLPGDTDASPREARGNGGTGLDAVTGRNEDAPVLPPPGGERNGSGSATTPGWALGSEGNPAPRYPYTARVRGWQGLVILDVSVRADGSVADIEIRESSGRKSLDGAAKKAVRTWMFKPARERGRPVPGSALVPIRFSLTDPRQS